MRGVMGPLTDARINAIIRAVKDEIEAFSVIRVGEHRTLRLYLRDGDIWEISCNRTVRYVYEFATGKPYKSRSQ